MGNKARVFTLILEPASGCNLSCDYCYAEFDSDPVMTFAILQTTIDSTFSYLKHHGFSELHIIYHGSEPLLVGLSWYLKALRYIESHKSSLKIRHFIQTNGLLLDHDTCTLLLNYDIQVGVSLDGPAWLHDRFRHTGSGGESLAMVLEAIDLLEHHGIAFGINAVVSRLSLGREESIYTFFKELGHPVQFNPLLPGKRASVTRPFLLQPGEWGKYLIAVFEQWSRDPKDRIRVAPLDAYLRSIIYGYANACQQQPSCTGSNLAIKANGDAVLCSRFSRPLLGNISEKSVTELMGTPWIIHLQDRAKQLKRCAACRFQQICYGGCPHNAVAFSGQVTGNDPLCMDYKLIFNHLKNALQKLDQAGY